MNKKQAFLKFLESLKGHDQDVLIESVKEGFKAYVESMENRTDKNITITYETWDEESVEVGETDDRGWIDEEGISLEPDEDDIAEGKTLIDTTVEYLQKEGVIHPSDSIAARWWSTEEDLNYRTGERTIKSYHLNNYTAEERAEIQRRMEGK
jgi:hypothetical protein